MAEKEEPNLDLKAMKCYTGRLMTKVDVKMWMDLTGIKDVLLILDDTIPFTTLCPVALTPETDTLSKTLFDSRASLSQMGNVNNVQSLSWTYCNFTV